MQTKTRHRIRRITRLCLISTAVLATVTLAFIAMVPSPVQDAINWPSSPALLDNNGRLFHVRLSSREEYSLPIPLEKMGKWLPLVAVEVEDRRFYHHPGIDPLALIRAAFQNIRSGEVVSGASTITSQCVRMTYPSRRSASTKVREFAQALRLDAALSKNDILELYLNRAPFGGPVRGVEAASRAYFGKRAEELSLAEAALLIGMLRGPSVYRPDRNPAATVERRNSILKRLAGRDRIPARDLELALLESLPPGRRFIPAEARHFADFTLRSLPAGYWESTRPPVATTLDSAAQLALEQSLDAALASRPEPVTAAGGIADPATGALLAYVGNRRLSVADGRNWVDCGISPRSPGSLLKPFVYLTAMEQGKLVPASLLADTPLSFGGDAPRNYDRRYRGPVNAGRALADSLNAPAVRVLRVAGGDSVIHTLRRAGITTLTRDAAWYGDALAIGGCEVSLVQALEAYAGLAALGQRRPLTSLADIAQHPDRMGSGRFASPAGAYLVADSLNAPSRLPAQQALSLWAAGQSIGFKTGTSYGHRDAWAAAFTPDKTAVIWLGDPSGDAVAGLAGQVDAAPSAVNLLAQLDRESKWFEPPKDAEQFTACALSGDPASPACPSTGPAWRIAGITATRPCDMHFFRNGELVTRLPAALENFIRFGAPEFSRTANVQITLPRHRETYFLSPEAPTPQVSLTAEGARGDIYWYLDGEFLGLQAEGGSLALPLSVGEHRLSLVDGEGRRASVRFSVVDVMEQRPVLELQ